MQGFPRFLWPTAGGGLTNSVVWLDCSSSTGKQQLRTPMPAPTMPHLLLLFLPCVLSVGTVGSRHLIHLCATFLIHCATVPPCVRNKGKKRAKPLSLDLFSAHVGPWTRSSHLHRAAQGEQERYVGLSPVFNSEGRRGREGGRGDAH